VGRFVRRKSNKRWTWVALGVACVVVDRGEATCRRLWEAIPPAYRAWTLSSYFWAADAAVFPSTGPCGAVAQHLTAAPGPLRSQNPFLPNINNLADL